MEPLEERSRSNVEMNHVGAGREQAKGASSCHVWTLSGNRMCLEARAA